MKNKILYGLLGVLLIVAAFVVSGFLIKSKPAPKTDNKKHNVVYVKASKVEEKATEANMKYRGRVTAFDNVALAAEVSGKLMQGDVRFKAGEKFKKGDVLINIYSEDIKATLKSGKSNFMQTLSVILPDIKVDFPEEFTKWNTFFNQVDPDKSLPQLPEINTEKEKVFLASNNVLASYYTLQQQEINLKRYTIYAPFYGSFKTVNKEIGSIASPGAELATIIRSDKLEIVVPVFPDELDWIKEGDKVTVTDNDSGNHTAIVSRIAGFVDENTQSVNVYLTYRVNGKGSYLEGEYVDVIFKGAQITGFEIPREAIVDKSSVYQLENGKLSKTSIEIKRQLDDSYIIAGLEANKTIVTESLASIDPTSEYQAR
ncbi:HlyD family efflux transporter periplasmic adaptor subunit [Puteibacter caeruleilacunae]|nr:HlyD family efflux transporter periplasmic adaptor subunit [Puteibacter caeruleilacunae]